MLISLRFKQVSWQCMAVVLMFVNPLDKNQNLLDNETN